MRVKFNRGPMSGKRSDIADEYARDYIIRENLPLDWRAMRESGPGDFPLSYREGSYHRSNVVLKNGTVVFEWMGWKHGGKAI